MEKHNTNPNSLSAELLKRGTPVAQPTIFRILVGESRDPRTKNTKALADYFGVSTYDLYEHDLSTQEYPGNGNNSNVTNTEFAGAEKYEIAYWVVRGSCGGGAAYIEETTRGRLAKDSGFFLKYGIQAENAVAVYADGNSMADFIVDGDIVIFDKRKTEPRSGKIFLIEHPDGMRIRQLRRNIDASWILENRNPDKRQYPDETLAASQSELLKIIGEFVYREGG